MSNLATRAYAWLKGWLGAALPVIAVAISAPAAAQQELRFSEAWSPEDCGLLKLRVKDPAPACGFVSVPLRHGDAESPRIRLAVVVIPALDKVRRQPDPLFLAQGGPGGSTIGGFAQVLLDDPAKRPVLNRDLVLWDQRGTYFSQPRLLCRELGQLPSGADAASCSMPSCRSDSAWLPMCRRSSNRSWGNMRAPAKNRRLAMPPTRRSPRAIWHCWTVWTSSRCPMSRRTPKQRPARWPPRRRR